MPATKREKTRYPGVYFVMGTSIDNKPEMIFYIVYRKDGRLIEEKAGRQFKDAMTAARASQLRARRIYGDELPNKERRRKEMEASNPWTINRLWEEFQQSKAALKGLKKDEYKYDKHIRERFGDMEPKDIQPIEIDKYRNELLKKLKPATVRGCLEFIRRLVNFGVKKQLCPGLSFQIEMPRVDNGRMEDLTPEQVKKLMEALDKEPDIHVTNMIRMALFTGMRRGELFKLEWRDVDFERGFITIRDPKGGKDQIIPMNSKARAVLETHPRSTNPLVFPGKHGKQRTEFRRGPVDRIKTAAGLPDDFRALHGLRHSFASMLASSGEVDMYTLQRLMTHKSPQMTQRYAHLRDAALRRASEMAGSIIADMTSAKKSE